MAKMKFDSSVTPEISSLSAPTSAGSDTFSTGSEGQILRSDGTNVYWGNSEPTVLQTKTYTNFVASGNSDPAGWYYFGKIIPKDNYCVWKIKYKLTVNVPKNSNNTSYYMYYDYNGTVEFNGTRQDILNYQIYNNICNTSYRSIYNHILYRALTAQASTAGHLPGIRFQSSGNPTSTNYARTIKIDILELENCTFTFFDNLTLYANVSPTGSSYYYTRTEYNGTDSGLRETGDDNSVNQLQYPYTQLKAGTNGYFGYQLIMRTGTDTWEGLTTTNGQGTAKTINKTPFYPDMIYYFVPWNNNKITSGNYCSTNQIYKAYSLIDCRYSFNCGTTLTGRKPLYLVGTFNSNGMFIQDDVNYTQDLPTTENNKYYIYLGEIYYENNGNCYRIDFHVNNPIYYYKDGGIKEYKNIYVESSGGGITYSAGTDLQLTGTTFNHDVSGATEGSYGNSSNQTPAYGGTFNVPYMEINDRGHVTLIRNQTVKIPASDNNWRGVVNSLASESTTESLTAAQGKVLNDKINKIVRQHRDFTVSCDKGGTSANGNVYVISPSAAADVSESVFLDAFSAAGRFRFNSAGHYLLLIRIDVSSISGSVGNNGIAAVYLEYSDDNGTTWVGSTNLGSFFHAGMQSMSQVVGVIASNLNRLFRLRIQNALGTGCTISYGSYTSITFIQLRNMDD